MIPYTHRAPREDQSSPKEHSSLYAFMLSLNLDHHRLTICLLHSPPGPEPGLYALHPAQKTKAAASGREEAAGLEGHGHVHVTYHARTKRAAEKVGKKQVGDSSEYHHLPLPGLQNDLCLPPSSSACDRQCTRAQASSARGPERVACKTCDCWKSVPSRPKCPQEYPTCLVEIAKVRV